jgi:hypothetical protein
MNILDHNAAKHLFEKVKSLAQQPHNSWRCIYLNLDKQDRFNAGRQGQFVVGTLVNLLADADGYIYLCDDGDIFILFQGPMKQVMNKLSGYFSDLKPRSLYEAPADSLCTIFDLSKYWQVFFNLCKAKSLQPA